MTAGEPLSLATLAARLADEPFGLTLEQIGKLTLWQVNHVYFHPRDREGKLVVVPSAGVPYEELFWDIWRARGLPDWRIEQKWQEHQRQEAAHGKPGAT